MQGWRLAGRAGQACGRLAAKGGSRAGVGARKQPREGESNLVVSDRSTVTVLNLLLPAGRAPVFLKIRIVKRSRDLRKTMVARAAYEFQRRLALAFSPG